MKCNTLDSMYKVTSECCLFVCGYLIEFRTRYGSISLPRKRPISSRKNFTSVCSFTFSCSKKCIRLFVCNSLSRRISRERFADSLFLRLRSQYLLRVKNFDHYGRSKTRQRNLRFIFVLDWNRYRFTFAFGFIVEIVIASVEHGRWFWC